MDSCSALPRMRALSLSYTEYLRVTSGGEFYTKNPADATDQEADPKYETRSRWSESQKNRVTGFGYFGLFCRPDQILILGAA
jgi:hypothetical protein